MACFALAGVTGPLGYSPDPLLYAEAQLMRESLTRRQLLPKDRSGLKKEVSRGDLREALWIRRSALHGGHVPQWLAQRMTIMGTAIAESILLHYGPGEFLSRLSDPFLFQAFGSVMGMDWHSSGITTSVMGALKRGLNPRAAEIGLYVCGGRGKASRSTPEELHRIAEAEGLN